MAQSAHAATAVLERYKDRSEVKAYLGDLANMRKVVMEVCSCCLVTAPFSRAS